MKSEKMHFKEWRDFFFCTNQVREFVIKSWIEIAHLEVYSQQEDIQFLSKEYKRDSVFLPKNLDRS